MNILIVDDNQDLADGLADLLETEGHQTIICYTGEMALDIVKTRDLDTVLLDAKLPGIGGAETLYHIHKLKPGVKVIIMTAHRIDKFMSESIDTRPVNILRKPFSDHDLLQKLQSINKGIILVANDATDFIANTEKLLRQHNYKPLMASTKKEAIEKGTTSEFDVLILDLQLPALACIDIYHKLKKHAISLPIIFRILTTNNQNASTNEFHSLSAMGCLFKPFTPDELLHGIESVHMN